MEDQQIKEATQEAVDTAADAVQETAKAVDNAVETAATNRHVAGEAAAAVEESAKAVTQAVETAAENKEAVHAASAAMEETARAVGNAVETASENSQAFRSKESMDDYKDAIDNSMRKIDVGDVVKGTVIAVSEEEATVDLAHYAAGIVRRQDFSANPKFNLLDDVRIGDEISAIVKKTDDGHGNLLLSVKDAAQKLSWDILQEAMKEKKTLSVKITDTVKAGVIAYPEGLRAFIPASKLALSFVEDAALPSFVGKTIEARVVTCDPEGKKLVLSAKEILREQADKERAAKVSNVRPGLVTEGTVETLTDFGAFVDLGEGLSGLVHVSRISQERIKLPADVLKVGDKVKVKVMQVKDGKISLSMKDVEGAAQVEAVQEEHVEYKSGGEVTTSLADLIKKAGF